MSFIPVQTTATPVAVTGADVHVKGTISAQVPVEGIMPAVVQQQQPMMLMQQPVQQPGYVAVQQQPVQLQQQPMLVQQPTVQQPGYVAVQQPGVVVAGQPQVSSMLTMPANVGVASTHNNLI